MLKFIVLFFLTSCSVYIPVEYRKATDFVASKGSILQISIAKEVGVTAVGADKLVNQFASELQREGWWTYAKDNNLNKNYELVITEFKTNAEKGSSSTQNSEGKTYRTSYYKTSGSAKFQIRKKGESSFVHLSTSIDGLVSSEKEMPNPHGSKSLAPFFEALTGFDREANAISGQDFYLSLDAYDAREKLISAILAKMTPLKIVTKVLIEDSEDDMDPLTNLLKANDFESANKYLRLIDGKSKRSDILYNLGAVLEAQGQFMEACSNYQNAYKLNPKSLYLEQKIGCDLRLQHFNKINGVEKL
jgi:tetratricopeptide (TPR) repeat protein